jgi:transcriptional regulator with XRE-family HTH domain
MLNIDYIKSLMVSHNMTIGQLAVKFGISKAQLSRLLQKKRGAGSKTITGILKAFPDADKDSLFLP